MKQCKYIIIVFCVLIITPPLFANEKTIPNDSITFTIVFNPQSNLDIKERFTDLSYKLNKDMEEFRKPIFNIATPTIIIISIIFLIILTITLPILLIKSYRDVYWNKKRLKYELKLNEILYPYILSESLLDNPPTLKEINDKFYTRILIKFTSDNLKTYKGLIAERYLNVYRHNIPTQLAVNIVKGKSDYEKSMIMREVCSLNPRPETAKYSVQYFNSKNRDLCLWAHVFYLIIHPEETSTLLNKYPYELTQWEKIVFAHYLNNNFTQYEQSKY